MTVAPLKAYALVDENGISLSHLIAVDRLSEWQADLEALTEKLAQKGKTHQLRLVPVTIVPEEAKP